MIVVAVDMMLLLSHWPLHQVNPGATPALHWQPCCPAVRLTLLIFQYYLELTHSQNHRQYIY